VTEPYQLRDATAGDFDAIFELLALAFGNATTTEMVEIERPIFEPARDQVIVHSGQIVGNTAAFTRALSVPGGPVPAAHVTFVAVAPTHRRRGLLNRLMRHQLHGVPEPVAVLWASEGRIYQRYGYGMAARSAHMEIRSREVDLPPSAAPAGGNLRAAVPTAVHKELSEVYRRLCLTRPGLSSRDQRVWDVVTADPEGRRNGFTVKRALLYESTRGVTGYALWRTKAAWDSHGPAGEVQVLELLAEDPVAYAELWRFLLRVDLTRTVHMPLAGADEPLQHLVNEPRQLGLRSADGLWVRLVDLRGALAARRYSTALDVVLDVTDSTLPANAGRWRLRVDGDGTGQCTPAPDATAEVACDVADLGAAYLGGTSLAQLALAGRVRELRPGALAPLATAFGWPVAPAAIEVF
jgi:predicted acetyltransferase